MDLTKFKELTKKATFLKNYASLLVPIIITFVSIILFIPGQLISGGLKKQVENESISIGKKIKTLNSSAVPKQQWKIEEEYQKEFSNEANQVALMAQQSSQRELLSYKIFPEPKETSTLVFKQLGQNYRAAVDELLIKLNAHDCPTAAEITMNVESSLGVNKSSYGGEAEKTITDALCKARAKVSNIYISNTDLPGYKFWENYEYVSMEQAVRDAWFWQIGFWITEDVLNTIGNINSKASNVLDSPVKRLFYVTFSKNHTAKDLGITPLYVAAIKDVLFLPHTARLSNEDIDVVHFEFSVVIRQGEIMPFIKQLSTAKEHKFYGFNKEDSEKIYKHNQITVLGMDLVGLDLTNLAQNYYRYGDDPVTNLILSCEYVFDKKGYDPIRPVVLKKEASTNQ